MQTNKTETENAKTAKTKAKKTGSFKSLMHIYKTTKIPWLFLALVVVMTFGTQILSNLAVPYSTKIDLGDMKGAGFLAGYIIISVMYEFLDASYDIVNGIGKAKMSVNLRLRLLKKLFHLPVSFYDEEDPQKLVSRVTVDSAYAYTALSSLIQLISIFYGIYLAIKSMAEIYSGFTPMLLISVPFMILFGWLIGKMGFKMENLMIDAYSKQTNYYAERMPNMQYIKNNCMEEAEFQKGRHFNNYKAKADVKYGALYMGTSILNSVATVVCSYIILWVASGFVRNGTMEMSEMVQLYTYAGEVMANAAMITTVWQVVKMAFGGSDKIAQIDAMEEEDRSGSETDVCGKDIVFSNVKFGYQEDKTVLDDLSFHIPYGKVTAIVGRNGCGKSTALRLLERFDAPESGQISIGDINLKDVDLETWRDSVGYVFQNKQMIAGTISENIGYGKREAGAEEIEAAARKAEAYDFIAEREDGFEEEINPFDVELSGGQQQRISIARALLKNPEYLILDEATSGLDTVTEEKVFATVKEQMKGKTVIMIAHNMNLIEKADHFVVMDKGRLLKEGTFEEVKEAIYGY